MSNKIKIQIIYTYFIQFIGKKKGSNRHSGGTMSHIQGVKRPLCHTNSFTGEKTPKFGVETPHEEELGTVNIFLYFVQNLISVLL